ncbi:hypothetical protein E3Z27_25530 [Pseudomonas mediterranea]|nr:hypothetical protein E3Z27_25530 [Pseudomonas mediterranea]
MISASCSSTDFITDPQGSDSKGPNHTRSRTKYKACPARGRQSASRARPGLLRRGFGYILYSYFIFIMSFIFSNSYFKSQITYDHRTV